MVRGRVLVVACEDNLIRGASGVAVQNFNRMFDHDERTALADPRQRRKVDRLILTPLTSLSSPAPVY